MPSTDRTSGPTPAESGWPAESFLRILQSESLSEIVRAGFPRSFSAGDVLLHEGENSDHVFLLWSGWVKVTAVAQHNREVLLSIRVGGDIVGELGALDHRPRSATVTACGAVQAYRIGGIEFRRLVATSPNIASAAFHTFGTRFRTATRRRVELGGYSVRVRLFRLLAELCEGHGRLTHRGVVVGVRLTQAELASAVGASESAVHKALRELRDDGVAEFKWGEITVFRPKTLTERAELDTES